MERLTKRQARWRVRITIASALLVASTVLLLAATTPAHAQTTTVVEYYYADWDHYFVTADAAEIALLDGGAYGGVWKRTGETFTVGVQPGANFSETCRFFSTSFAPRSSHFYTPFPAECATVKLSADWQYEGIAFYVQSADANGACPLGTTSLYRLYNNGIGGAPNHRYTTSRATVDQMHARVWTSEGNGPDATFACLPAAVGSGTMATGIWTGMTNLYEVIRAIILPDGTYYILYSVPANTTDAGAVQGTATMSAGMFSSSDGRDYMMTSGRDGAAVFVSGTYISQTNLQLAIRDALGTRSLVATFVPGSDHSVSVAAVAGNYSGFTAHARGGTTPGATFTLDAHGNLAGSNSICSFEGQITPKASISAFDWSVSSQSCVFGSSISGVLYYDEVTRQVHGFAPFSSRDDLLFMFGTKQ